MKKFLCAIALLIAVMLFFVSCAFFESTKETTSTEKKDDVPVFSEGPVVIFNSDEKGRVTYTNEEILSDIAELEAKYSYLLGKDVISSKTIGYSLDGKEIKCVILGKADAEKKIIIQAGIHGREYISSMLTLKQLEYYLENYKDYKQLFDGVAFYIVPNANPDGIDLATSGIDSLKSEELKDTVREIYQSEYEKGYTETASGRNLTLEEYLPLWKANARGVDLNRNYDSMWESYKAGEREPSSKTHKGPSPESEPETVAMTEFVEGLEGVVCSVSVHIQGKLIYWDCNQEGQLREDCLELAALLNSVNLYKISDDTTNDASYTDWAVLKKGIPAVTLELGKNLSYSLITEDEFNVIWEENYLYWSVLAQNYK